MSQFALLGARKWRKHVEANAGRNQAHSVYLDFGAYVVIRRGEEGECDSLTHYFRVATSTHWSRQTHNTFKWGARLTRQPFCPACPLTTQKCKVARVGSNAHFYDALERFQTKVTSRSTLLESYRTPDALQCRTCVVNPGVGHFLSLLLTHTHTHIHPKSVHALH